MTTETTHQESVDVFTLEERVRLLLASPDAFAHWLRQECGPVAGSTGNPHACPLAHYLKSHLPFWCEPVVYGDLVRVHGVDRAQVTQEAQVESPPWAHRFVHAVDRVSTCAYGFDPVPRDQALRVLDEVLAQPADLRPT